MPALGMRLAALDQWPVLAGLGMSLGLGLLIGIQRGWTLRHEADGSRFAGIRTFGLLGLAGGLAGAIEPLDRVAAWIVFGVAALLIPLGYVRTGRGNGGVSGTAALAALIVLACGFLVTRGEAQIAAIVTVSTAVLLTLRPQLHRWVGGLAESEVSAIIRFALIALVVLPLLPDRHLGPHDAWNPHQLWLVVVFVSGFSFAGYIASKRLGPARGTLALAATGAMVSSTAVTTALATRLRNDDENAGTLIAGIAIASAVMLLRVIILVAMIAPIALGTLVLMIAPAAVVSVVAAVWGLLIARRAPAALPAAVTLRNPLNFGPALVLTGLVMVMALLARWLMTWIGESGIAIILALSGIADVDAAIITIGGLPPGVFDERTAGLVVAAPVLANTLFKAAIPPMLARTHRGWIASLPLLASVAAGLAMVPFVLR